MIRTLHQQCFHLLDIIFRKQKGCDIIGHFGQEGLKIKLKFFDINLLPGVSKYGGRGVLRRSEEGSSLRGVYFSLLTQRARHETV